MSKEWFSNIRYTTCLIYCEMAKLSHLSLPGSKRCYGRTLSLKAPPVTLLEGGLQLCRGARGTAFPTVLSIQRTLILKMIFMIDSLVLEDILSHILIRGLWDDGVLITIPFPAHWQTWDWRANEESHHWDSPTRALSLLSEQRHRRSRITRLGYRELHKSKSMWHVEVAYREKIQ